MAEQTLYLPHHFGLIIGSDTHRPWVAGSAAMSIDQPWRGQPAFATATDAFIWLEWVRTRSWHPPGMAVAHVSVRTEPDPQGIVRAYAGARQLLDPSCQVLRGDPTAAGPDEQVLAACYGIARTEAARVWLIDQAGARSRDRIAAALATTWNHGYRIAARDARTALAGQIDRTIKAALADLPTDDPARLELNGLGEAAATVAAAAALITVPDPPTSIIEPAKAAFAESGELSGWDNAHDLLWQHTLRTAALHAVIGAATDVEIMWRVGRTERQAATTRIGGQEPTSWVAAMLREANRCVAAQWLLASAEPQAPASRRSPAAEVAAPTAVSASAETGQPDDRLARSFVTLTALGGDDPSIDPATDASAPHTIAPPRRGR